MMQKSLILHFNAHDTIVTKKRDLNGHGTVWYHPARIANNQSSYNVQKKHNATYHSQLRTGFIVHKADNNNHVFTQKEAH